MPQGTIRWFNRRKGFGFIAGDDGTDVFVHFTEVQDNQADKLREGDLVEFEMIEGEKGPKAAKVIRKDTPNSD